MTTWTVPARVTRVVDGDTLVVDLDLGWGLWRVAARVRLAGIDCPEMNTPEGRAARDFAAGLMVVGDQVMVVSKSLDKYGRTLGYVRLSDGKDLSATLVAAGHAKVVL